MSKKNKSNALEEAIRNLRRLPRPKPDPSVRAYFVSDNPPILRVVAGSKRQKQQTKADKPWL
jgi:hypothetical protein